MREFEGNKDIEKAWMFVEHTDRNVFLTGKAGTGKTTFLKYVREHSSKRLIVAAPTGVAAINANGVTLHSFFQLSFGPLVPEAIRESDYTHKFSKIKIDIIKTLDLLIIDEISMVRADVLDAVDLVLRRFRRHDLPFGGVQLLLIGDMQQLPPVVKEDEQQLLAKHYASPYFFWSKALAQTQLVSIELKRIYRQQDEEFITLLNAVRDNKADSTTLKKLNSRVNEKAKDEDGTIVLCTHNAAANKINEEKIKGLEGKEMTFDAEIDGIFSESLYPVDKELKLKEGAQVMFCKNDTQNHEFYNGKIGTVTSISDEKIVVKCDEDDYYTDVPKMTWDNVKYTIDPKTEQIKEEKEGSFKQYPLRLAWAITIHKSQGLTFDKVVIDASSAFSHGQVYVALSRCRTLEGIKLLKPIPPYAVITDHEISEFTRNVEENQPNEEDLERAEGNYKRDVLKYAFDMSYINAYFSTIERIDMTNPGAIPLVVTNKLSEARSRFNTEIFAVSIRFSNLIDTKYEQDTKAEKDAELAKKIKGGATYFIEKVEEIIGPIMEMEMEFDNQDVNERLEAVNKILTERWNECRAMLEVCKEEFEASEVVKAKNKARLGEGVKPTARKKKAIGDELYAALDTWREEKAEEQNMTKATVLSTKKLLELSEKKPHEVKELKKLLTPQKLKKYGLEILKIINKQTKYDTTLEDMEEEMAEEKKTTYEKTLEMYEKGMSAKEIAKERGMSESTIEGHLEKLATEEKIDANDFVTTYETEKVRTFIEKHKTKKIKEIYDGMDGKMPYLKIRMAMIVLEKM